ncbi:tetratricopeptide repeat protein [Sphingomonas sp. IW22]|uniref:tetratricopeptide repeat protein n=1 Tax=Sphingomonas sp. IW22 TaxID=3242489 RepID=UPI003522213A
MRQSAAPAAPVRARPLPTSIRTRSSFIALPVSASAWPREIRRLDRGGGKEKVQALTEQRDRAARAFSQGLAHGGAGRHDLALECFQEATEHDANHVAARFNLALVLRHLGRRTEAVGMLRTILDRIPDQPDTLFCLAGALNELGDYPAALAHLLQLEKIAPRHPGLDEALGLALLRAEAPWQAEAPLRRAIVQDPAAATTLNNLGAAFMAQRRPADAERLYRRATIMDDTVPAYRKNLGVSELLQGKLVSGFRHYEARREQAIWGSNRSFPGIPEWRGEAIAGRTILIYFEQGLGDTIQFVRYLAVLKARGARTIFLCQPELVALLAGVAGIDHLMTDGDPLPDFDCHTSLMSVPDRLARRFRPFRAAFPISARSRTLRAGGPIASRATAFALASIGRRADRNGPFPLKRWLRSPRSRACASTACNPNLPLSAMRLPSSAS